MGKKDKSKDKNKSKTRGLSRGEAELWREVTRDVRKLPGRTYDEIEDDEEDALPKRETVSERVSIAPKTASKNTPTAKDVDRRTSQKFTRGQMEIEGTIDLHGLGQAEAREALRRFITASHSRGKRCVLVITGKGLLDKPGVLKTRVPGWLDELGPVVLKTASAQPKHGGQGALYVLLRRQRD